MVLQVRNNLAGHVQTDLRHTHAEIGLDLILLEYYYSIIYVDSQPSDPNLGTSLRVGEL